MEISFDKRGNVTPYEIHQVDILFIEELLVNNMVDSKTRIGLFENYKAYNDELSKLISQPFY